MSSLPLYVVDLVSEESVRNSFRVCVVETVDRRRPTFQLVITTMRWQAVGLLATVRLRNSIGFCEQPRSHLTRLMATRDDRPPTTNAEDLREAAKLQARLKETRHKKSAGRHSTIQRVPAVEIAEGRHKYVLIRASIDGEEQFIVTSRRGASYHRNAAEPMIAKLEAAGYYDIDVTGGGRIDYEVTTKSIKIYGFSYGFGKANHAIAQRTVQEDPRYKEYDVTISDDGY